MGIEFRRGRPYFYRKQRRGGHVVSEYVGGGVLGLIVAERAESERAERVEAADDWRAERERMEAEDRAAAEYFREVEVLVTATLTAAGYHRPKRRWRKRRGRRNDAGGPG